MNDTGNVTGAFKTDRGFVKISLAIIKFEEDGYKIIYCPAIDVSGYGLTDEEAEESFKISLSEFFRYTINKGTFDDELRRMGWIIPKSKHKQMTPPTMSKLLSENDNFSRIFNDHTYIKTDRTIDFPVAV